MMFSQRFILLLDQISITKVCKTKDFKTYAHVCSLTGYTDKAYKGRVTTFCGENSVDI